MITKDSIWTILNLPDYVWNPLFLFSVVLLLAYFLDDMDFGFIKIPKFNPETRITRLFSSLVLISVLITARVPFFPSTDPRLAAAADNPRESNAQYAGFPPYSASGSRIFSFNDRILGELTFNTGELPYMAEAIAGDEFSIVQGEMPDLSITHQAALALAEKSFSQKEYYNSANFYEYAVSAPGFTDRQYVELTGMVTAGLYGAGQHRKGLLEICSRYKSHPTVTHQYRHAVHAHIRKIALQESYHAAESAIRFLRSNYNCAFDDFTSSWIPIPLKFMEFLEKGQYYAASIDAVDQNYSIQKIEGGELFSDYLLLLLGGERNLMRVINDYPQSYVYDIALLKIAQTVETSKAPNFVLEFVSKYPESPAIPSLILKSANDLNSSSNISLSDLETFYHSSRDILRRPDVINQLLHDAPEKLSVDLAIRVFENEKLTPNTALSAKILFAQKLSGSIGVESFDIFEIQERISESEILDDLRSLQVLNFRRECSKNQDSFEVLDFTRLIINLQTYYSIFSNSFGGESFEISSSLNLSEYRTSLPCAKSFGSSSAKLMGSDFQQAIDFVRRADIALKSKDGDSLSEIAVSIHACHMKRILRKARKDLGVCGALSRLLPISTNFGDAVNLLHMLVYDLNRSKYYKHLFLSAMANKRDGNIQNYTDGLILFISRHDETYLIDDVYTELGWYYLKIGELEDAERYLRYVLDNYSNMNAYDNALYWLSDMYKKNDDFIGSASNQAKLAAYILSRRVAGDKNLSEDELRSQTPK